ncbi:hypothetical protein PSTG_04607 [Puccinia striiformis f. sp. tritici PST-78]|uniref:Uncharacterized protein n=1 Tax=Puccinia striiformis f. sp. tritici PST-78 TaxID=1165861 RepID=A0A0L0VS60_9BASI|nr:hypothetical protein PSTG_04607 [Puccinia striiformis f. sp. tritici PST-78]
MQVSKQSFGDEFQLENIHATQRRLGSHPPDDYTQSLRTLERTLNSMNLTRRTDDLDNNKVDLCNTVVSCVKVIHQTPEGRNAGYRKLRQLLHTKYGLYIHKAWTQITLKPAHRGFLRGVSSTLQGQTTYGLPMGMISSRSLESLFMVSSTCGVARSRVFLFTSPTMAQGTSDITISNWLLFIYLWVPLLQVELDEWTSNYNNYKQRWDPKSMLPKKCSAQWAYEYPKEVRGEQGLIPVPASAANTLEQEFYPEGTRILQTSPTWFLEAINELKTNMNLQIPSPDIHNVWDIFADLLRAIQAFDPTNDPSECFHHRASLFS